MVPAPVQPQPCPEDLLWSGLSFPVLSEEELARSLGAAEDRVHYHRGVWWKQVLPTKPFFCVPCVRLTQVDHEESWPHPLCALGGFMHSSKPNAPTNGKYRAIVYEQVANYSISDLSRQVRQKVRRALPYVEVRVVDNLNDLLVDGYEVYVSWHNRVQWGQDKTGRGLFHGWIVRASRQKGFFPLGAYVGDKLVAFLLPHAVNGVAAIEFLASHSSFLKFRINDLLMHAFLCIARQTPDLGMADLGAVSAKASLNEFKLHYGVMREFASYTWINPLVRTFAIRWIRRRYPWLVACTN